MSSKHRRPSRGLPDAKRRRKGAIDLTDDAVPIEAAAADAAAAAAAAAAFAERTTAEVRLLLAMTADLDSDGVMEAAANIIVAHATGKGVVICTQDMVNEYQRTQQACKGGKAPPIVGDKLRMRLPTCTRQEPPQETAHDRLRRKLN